MGAGNLGLNARVRPLKLSFSQVKVNVRDLSKKRDLMRKEKD